MAGKRQPSRMEALAVLRGELDYWQHLWRQHGTAECGGATLALTTAIQVLEGERSPSQPAPGTAELPSWLERLGDED